MADRGKQPVTDDVPSTDVIWANQKDINRRLDDLAADVQRLMLEVRREFNLIKARLPQQPVLREGTPANRQRRMRGRASTHLERRNPVMSQEESDSDEEVPWFQRTGDHKTGDEESREEDGDVVAPQNYQRFH
ncbi:hypothetical protein KFK09_007810 [Dendrobium nobile]|uniref:Uncharacterized protein n=1 Tax=Dendrobium nobile TaxID=94219 RepID=A0A8T3BSX5_DENNO|nr:hypothetical protein KFK09_007810 [Dendrobium nobile]